MTVRYEVCALLSASKDRLVCGPFALLDTALDEARRRSQTTPYDLLVVLVDEDRHGLMTRHVRAFAVCGRVDWAKRCDACLGQGYTDDERNAWRYRLAPPSFTRVQVPCSFCSGVGACPESTTLRPPPPSVSSQTPVRG
jgi:hypothetical protein